MAKAGTGKGNAFKAPGPSYPHLQLVRSIAQGRAVLDEAGRTQRESNILKLVADEPLLSIEQRKRITSDVRGGINLARRGVNPVLGHWARDCKGCRTHGGTHHFLCQNIKPGK